MVFGVFGCHFQAAGDMVSDKFFGICVCGLVAILVVRAVEQQVIAHAAAYEALFDTWHGIDGSVDVKQRLVVSV